jgi:hypothetical protein
VGEEIRFDINPQKLHYFGPDGNRVPEVAP